MLAHSIFLFHRSAGNIDKRYTQNCQFLLNANCHELPLLGSRYSNTKLPPDAENLRKHVSNHAIRALRTQEWISDFYNVTIVIFVTSNLLKVY